MGRLAEETARLARLVASAGGRAWLVGGAVRDGLLAADFDAAAIPRSLDACKDADVEVFGLDAATLRETVAARYAFDECGVSFGVLKLKGVPIDVSMPRRESKLSPGHKGFAVDSDPRMSVAEAASRRDFTVNAIYFDPLGGAIADPFGGADDLRNGILRHVSPKFAEDPLRVLRGMQFTARFGLEPAPETIALCSTMGLEGLARERIMEEWSKLLLRGRRISKGLEFLRATGWTRHFPELERLIGCKQDPLWHPEGDVWNHTLAVMDAFAAQRTGDDAEDLVVGFAALCHDFGKPATTRFDPSDGHIRSRGHDEAGVEPTLSFLRRFTAEERLLREVPPLVRCHMRPFAMYKSKSGDNAVRRLAAQVGRIDRLVRVCRADAQGAGAPGGHPELEWLEERAEALRVADSAPKPILLGRHLLSMGLKPSPMFGKWLAACYDAQLDGRFADLDGAVEWFKKTRSGLVVDGAEQPVHGNGLALAPQD